VTQECAIPARWATQTNERKDERERTESGEIEAGDEVSKVMSAPVTLGLASDRGAQAPTLASRVSLQGLVAFWGWDSFTAAQEEMGK
jgi:hypothetical protein